MNAELDPQSPVIQSVGIVARKPVGSRSNHVGHSSNKGPTRMGVIVLLIFGSGIAISGWLGFLGLVKGELQFSKDTVLHGSSARTAGVLCLCFSVGFLGVCV